MLAAGVTVGITGGLVGAMAATQPASTASATNTTRSSVSTDDGRAQPYSQYDDNSSASSSDLSVTPRAHTRTGGS